MTIDAQQALALAKALCESEGYSVIPRVRWVTPTSIARELEMSGSWLHKQLHRTDCPNYEERRGPTGRLIELRATPELMRWLRDAVKARFRATGEAGV